MAGGCTSTRKAPRRRTWRRTPSACRRNEPRGGLSARAALPVVGRAARSRQDFQRRVAHAVAQGGGVLAPRPPPNAVRLQSLPGGVERGRQRGELRGVPEDEDAHVR